MSDDMPNEDELEEALLDAARIGGRHRALALALPVHTMTVRSVVDSEFLGMVRLTLAENSVAAGTPVADAMVSVYMRAADVLAAGLIPGDTFTVRVTLTPTLDRVQT